MKIGITGATGFVGSHLLKKIIEQNHDVKILVHEKRNNSTRVQNVELCYGSVDDLKSLESFCDNLDVLYHLVGIIAETKTKTFDKTVAQGTKNIVKVAIEKNLKKIVYLSALGASEHALSKYHQTKFIAEQAVIGSQIEYVIFRPSILYGQGDGFISMLDKLIQYSPFVPVIGSGKYRMQPLYIDDLVAMMTKVEHVKNEIIEVGGPEKLEYLQILDLLKKVLGKKRLNFFLPTMFMKFVASLLERIVKPAPITRDQLIMMELGSTCDTLKMHKLFSIDPVSLEDGLQKYMR